MSKPHVTPRLEGHNVCDVMVHRPAPSPPGVDTVVTAMGLERGTIIVAQRLLERVLVVCERILVPQLDRL